MRVAADEFVNECENIFRFLVDDYLCRKVGVEKARQYASVTYKNSTTGVKITFEPFENGVFVRLIRLRNGEIPPYLDAPVNWVYVASLIALRAPEFRVLRKPFDQPLSLQELRLVLSQYASALGQYADDVLKGDFSVFPEIRRWVSQDAP